MMRRTVLAVLVVGVLAGGVDIVFGLDGTALAAEAPRQIVTYVPPATKVFPVATVNYSQQISGASVKVVSGLIAKQDRLYLQYNGGASIASSYDATTGTLTITGRAVGVEWANILKSVYYSNVADVPKTGDRLVVAQLGPDGTSLTPAYYNRFSTAIRIPTN
jgi:hypothetical protein